MRKVLSWIDSNGLSVLAGFLLVFIPLYPKLPLFDILPGYIVRVRLEDFLVAFTIAFFILQLIRRKVVFRFDLVSKGLIVYLIVGFLSVLAAIFIVSSVPLALNHVGKTFLHWLRRIEYLSLFFIVLSGLNSNRKVKIMMGLFFATLLLVTVYGYGQKYYYWPAFSTMNREFSKGWVLYLTEHARVLSTFGGHYDLAGYLVIALSLGWSFFYGAKDKLQKLIVGLLVLGGFWLLILTASRISFIGYLAGLSVVTFIWTFRRGLEWGVSRWLITISLSVVLMLSFGDLSDRFLKLLRISERVSGIKEILTRPQTAPPSNNSAFLENNLAAVTSKSDQPPTPRTQPVDVTGREQPLFLLEKTASGASVLVEKKRTYSSNAVMFDLSTGIRLDATWPRAIAGFLKDPLLGSGYATLTKTSVEEFTDAESTDNDYLRSLGETGILGFATFFGTIILMVWIAFKSLGGIKDSFLFSLTAGFIGLVVGLLLNAALIDIFEASKVAYVFWGTSGIAMAALYLNRESIKQNMQPLKISFSWPNFLARLKKFLISDFLWLGLILAVAFWLRTYKLGGPVADWHSWRQADTSAVTRNYIKKDRIDWLYPVYDDLSSVPSGKGNPLGLRYVEFPIYNVTAVYIKKIVPELTTEGTGRVTTALASVSTILFLFLIARKFFSRRVAYLSALSFGLIPYSIYYGRTILPDPFMVATALGAVWFMSLYIEQGKKRFWLLGLILATTSLLVKPYALFILASLGYVLVVNWRSFNIKKWLFIAIWAIVSVSPLLAWRWFISFHPEAIPASGWLFNGDGIRFKGAFWYWLFADRIGRLILGYWGLILLGLGLIRNDFKNKYRHFALFLFATSAIYLVVFATGNVRHDYYQILLLPSLSLLCGLGLDFLWSKREGLNLYISKGLAIGAFLFMLAFGWYFVKDYYNINHPEIVAAGKKVDDLVPSHAKVIAPYDGDTAFLYQTNRQGWPIVEKNIDYLISRGADYYVSVKYDDLTNSLIADSWPKGVEMPPKVIKKYKLIERNDKFVIVQLVPDNRLPKD